MSKSIKPSFFSGVRNYIKLSQELQSHLSKSPDDWKKFQNIFNLSLDKIYEDILQFEKKNINKSKEKIYKLKKIFEKRYRRYFLYGEFIKWSYEKPLGYSGDFKIIDNIYLNKPSTGGFNRLWDNYFQQLAAPKAIRERKEDFKNILANYIKKNKGKTIRIMNLASGPAREIGEFLVESDVAADSNLIFDCYDFDLQAINYARNLLKNTKNVNFIQKNAIRLALKKNIEDDIHSKYDLIYSLGLFDYLDERIAVKLVVNLKKLLNNGGLLIISNAGEKFSNASAAWMEWVAEWFLIYRTDIEFQKIFLEAGFDKNCIFVFPQKSKVMQYCFASNGRFEIPSPL